ncbi:MAG: hypothetical protein SGCHY_000251 [Lobulomycetales sp.]
MKKAYELSVLCECEVGIIIFNQGKLVEFCSSDMSDMLLRYTETAEPHEKRSVEDFQGQSTNEAEEEDSDADSPTKDSLASPAVIGFGQSPSQRQGDQPALSKEETAKKKKSERPPPGRVDTNWRKRTNSVARTTSASPKKAKAPATLKAEPELPSKSAPPVVGRTAISSLLHLPMYSPVTGNDSSTWMYEDRNRFVETPSIHASYQWPAGSTFGSPPSLSSSSPLLEDKLELLSPTEAPKPMSLLFAHDVPPQFLDNLTQ